MKRKPLKLYVWENVLNDWTSGIAFALARNPDEAREMIKSELGGHLPDEFSEPPLKVTEPEAFYVCGGG